QRSGAEFFPAARFDDGCEPAGFGGAADFEIVADRGLEAGVANEDAGGLVLHHEFAEPVGFGGGDDAADGDGKLGSSDVGGQAADFGGGGDDALTGVGERFAGESGGKCG